MTNHKEVKISRKPLYHVDHFDDEDRKDKEYGKWLAQEKTYRHNKKFPLSYNDIFIPLPTKSIKGRSPSKIFLKICFFSSKIYKIF
ncbi:hypothetical protein Fmac_028785 [Flemingia macrophylla]|uniref:Uncharacterized protein n=1 Tax=Flemingia macrophylla TaxID=520843 RepID=A0ABD1L8K7_9FABA